MKTTYSENRKLHKEGKHKCNKCRIIKPMTLEYFYPEYSKKIRSKTGFRCVCIDCYTTETYKNKNIPLIKKGRQSCSKCKKILPLSSKYWTKNKKSSHGFDRACKKCHALRHKINWQSKEYRKKIM